MKNVWHAHPDSCSSPHGISRRRFVLGTAAAGSLLALAPTRNLLAAGNPQTIASSQSAGASVLPTLRGNQFDLNLNYAHVNFTGNPATATTINGGLPGPILRWKQGDTVTLRVHNQLAQHSSVHWHGIILPSEMDGVPGLSFAGIHPGESFEYRFKVQQSGTYWYHSHSHFQEQTGLFGAIVIDPLEPDPVQADRDYVVMLSDWSDDDPHRIEARLKKQSHYYNYRERTVGDLWRDIRDRGVTQTWNERAMWNQMRMSENDISDVNGYAYTFLMNGQTPAQGWNALFKRGEKVRLRFINAAAMTFFDVRIPGLKMTVVAADGQLIDPVTVDDFRIGVAETYDVIVEPKDDRAYCIFAQSIDRTGFARGNLTPDLALQAEIPAMDPVPVLGHADMGMDMSHGEHAGHDMPSNSDAHAGHNMAGMDHGSMNHDMHNQHNMSTMNHAGMNHSTPRRPQMGTGKAGFGSAAPIVHAKTESGPQVDMLAEAPQYALDDPGIGLRDHQKNFGRRVLTYYDLCNYYRTPDPREPTREIQLHLTGNMHRYLWSFDGIPFSEAEPIHLKYGERVRFTLVNDTMMNHPIHLHGMWSDLETGDARYIPRKHTVIVQPGRKISYLVTADARGRWAYHCHLLYHMMGMMREVRVS